MGDYPLVSVIVIFYNEEQFIEAAIESIFAQTYKNWELLLVDDGSSDKSVDVAQVYVKNYPEKVRYLEHTGHQNRGMSASRNLGIANAKGEFVAFLDADDIWLPTKLERQVAVLTARPEVSMTYGPAQWWYSWTGKPEDRLRDFIHELGVSPNMLIQPPELLVRFLHREGISPCTCSVLLRREMISELGGFEETFQGLYEDQAFFAKVCLSAAVFVTSECLSRYRQHKPTNISNNKEAQEHLGSRRAFLKWLESYMAAKNKDSKEVLKALQIEMLPFRYPRMYKFAQNIKQLLVQKLSSYSHKFKSSVVKFPLIRQLRSIQFRRLQPLGNGRQWGTPIVRYYWDQYLSQYRSDIHGTALEVGTTDTIRQYGGLTLDQVDAIDLSLHSPEVTIVADLSRADHISSNTYDCFVNQFTSHLIYDIEAAIFHSIRILKPGGVLLINFPCVDYYFSHGLDMGTGKPLFMYWWFTPLQVENIFRGIGLEAQDFSLKVYGNLFTRIAYQLNLPAEELTQHEMEFSDPGHPLLVCARVVKPANWKSLKPPYRDPWHPQDAPAQWNPITGHYAD